MKTGPCASPPGPAAGRRARMASAIAVDRPQADFDAAKVARIAQAIRDGSLVVDAGRIADRLIANAEALLGHRPDRGPVATGLARCEITAANVRSNLETT